MCQCYNQYYHQFSCHSRHHHHSYPQQKQRLWFDLLQICDKSIRWRHFSILLSLSLYPFLSFLLLILPFFPCICRCAYKSARMCARVCVGVCDIRRHCIHVQYVHPSCVLLRVASDIWPQLISCLFVCELPDYLMFHARYNVYHFACCSTSHSVVNNGEPLSPCGTNNREQRSEAREIRCKLVVL